MSVQFSDTSRLTNKTVLRDGVDKLFSGILDVQEKLKSKKMDLQSQKSFEILSGFTQQTQVGDNPEQLKLQTDGLFKALMGIKVSMEAKINQKNKNEKNENSQKNEISNETEQTEIDLMSQISELAKDASDLLQNFYSSLANLDKKMESDQDKNRYQSTKKNRK